MDVENVNSVNKIKQTSKMGKIEVEIKPPLEDVYNVIDEAFGELVYNTVKAFREDSTQVDLEDYEYCLNALKDLCKHLIEFKIDKEKELQNDSRE